MKRYTEMPRKKNFTRASAACSKAGHVLNSKASILVVLASYRPNNQTRWLFNYSSYDSPTVISSHYHERTVLSALDKKE